VVYSVFRVAKIDINLLSKKYIEKNIAFFLQQNKKEYIFASFLRET